MLETCGFHRWKEEVQTRRTAHRGFFLRVFLPISHPHLYNHCATGTSKKMNFLFSGVRQNRQTKIYKTAQARDFQLYPVKSYTHFTERQYLLFFKKTVRKYNFFARILLQMYKFSTMLSRIETFLLLSELDFHMSWTHQSHVPPVSLQSSVKNMQRGCQPYCFFLWLIELLKRYKMV